MTLYQRKYRAESARHPDWDYATAGWYFITLCTRDRRHFFGKIQNDAMQLSALGQIVAEEWQHTAIVRPYVLLDEWVVMPNHFHAIVGIQNPEHLPLSDIPNVPVQNPNHLPLSDIPNVTVETSRRDVSTRILASQPGNGISASQPGDRVSPSQPGNGISRLQPKSLGSIVGQFKSICTRRIWAIGHREFAWQSRYHDHIIRNSVALDRIRHYIQTNPQQWRQDKFYGDADRDDLKQ